MFAVPAANLSFTSLHSAWEKRLAIIVPLGEMPTNVNHILILQHLTNVCALLVCHPSFEQMLG